MHLSCSRPRYSHEQPTSSSSSAMACETSSVDVPQEERNAVEVIDLDTDSDEEEAFTFDFDMDYDDDMSIASDNSHFSRTEVITEPEEYDSGHFATMPTDTATELSGMLYIVAQQFNLPREAYATIINIINDNVIPAAASDPRIKILSAYKCQKLAKAAHPVRFTRYSCCSDGCRLFDDLGEELDVCPPPCKAASRSFVSIASIADIIAAKLYHPSTRQQLLYRISRGVETNTVADIFDGSVYKKMVEEGCFQSPHDVAIGLGIDGFLPFKRGRLNCTVVNMTIYSVHPDQRYQKHNLSQIMIIPGKGKPKDLESFLAPLYEELDLLSRVGIKVVTADQGTISAKVHLMTFIGDIPAVADLVKHSGHMSYYGCRMCVVKGVRGQSDDPASGGMYFVGRTRPDLMRKLDDYKDSSQQGIGASAVARLHTFSGSHFFGLDEMHMIGHGLSKMLHTLFQPIRCNPMVMARDKQRYLSIPDYPFYLGTLEMKTVGADILASQPDIPQSFFNGNWDNIDTYSGSARAVDWMDFLLFVVPTLIVPSLYYSEAREIINNLIISIHLCLSWKLDNSDVSFIKTSIHRFQNYLSRNVTAGHLNQKCCTINLHYLGHISYMIQCLGPLPVFSCRSLERTIGQFKSKSLSKSSPGSSYQLILEKQASDNIYHALAALGEGSVPDLIVLGEPDRSSAPPDPVSYDILYDATNDHFERQGHGNNNITTNDLTFPYHRSANIKGKVFRSLFFNPANATTVNLGQSTFLLTTGSNEYFFGVVHFFFLVQLAGCSYNLVSLQVLRGVSKSNQVDRNIYPTWRHASGHYGPLIVVDIDSMVDGVGIVSDQTHDDIKHLVPSRQLIWDLTVLTNFDDIMAKLRRSTLSNSDSSAYIWTYFFNS